MDTVFGFVGILVYFGYYLESPERWRSLYEGLEGFVIVVAVLVGRCGYSSVSG